MRRKGDIQQGAPASGYATTIDLVAAGERKLLVGALHPDYYLPVALGLVWCSSFAAAAIFGVSSASEDDVLLRILALLAALTGLPLLAFVTTAVLALTAHGARIDRRRSIRWCDVTQVSVSTRQEDANILPGPVPLPIPVRRIYPVLHFSHYPYQVVVKQLGQRATKRGRRRLARHLAVLAERSHQLAPEVPDLADQGRSQRHREENLLAARPRRRADTD